MSWRDDVAKAERKFRENLGIELDNDQEAELRLIFNQLWVDGRNYDALWDSD